jgi:hypothetical protein
VIPYEWVDRRGKLLLTDWQLEANQTRQLKALLRTLEQVDLEIAAGSLIFHMGGGIYYSKINGEVALRPRSCVGPGDPARLTFLERVRKRDGVEEPLKKDSKAPERMEQIRSDSEAHRRVRMHHLQREGTQP